LDVALADFSLLLLVDLADVKGFHIRNIDHGSVIISIGVGEPLSLIHFGYLALAHIVLAA
jgi:hypothetical protein